MKDALILYAQAIVGPHLDDGIRAVASRYLEASKRLTISLTITEADFGKVMNAEVSLSTLCGALLDKLALRRWKANCRLLLKAEAPPDA